VCPLERDSETYALAGLTSYGGNECGRPNTPGFYTKVEQFIEWIEEHSYSGTNGQAAAAAEATNLSLGLLLLCPLFLTFVIGF